ncbi:uncharacterized protein LOC108603470 [Drosophila busckii]|uniref:uncharacterized protein LOC108603470 n=1 Tax=Drosophila busckii TaxID=30019 RepID=UPI00083EF125|nr:uncharacterized protein LOC108603470 [Drosophila busckii]
MAACNFMFNAVVSRLDTPNWQDLDIQKLKVVAELNNLPLTITASRINMSDVEPQTGIEFSSGIEQLRLNLIQCGMPITVFYGEEIIGNSLINFPTTVTDLVTEDMGNIMHCGSCSFERQGVVFGSIEILCCLATKCDEDANKSKSKRLCYQDNINPEDILFVMADTERCPCPCDPCLDTWVDEDSEQDHIQLGFMRYESFNAKQLKPEVNFMHDPTGKSICNEIKQMAQDYDDIVESIAKLNGQRPNFKPTAHKSELQVKQSKPFEETAKSEPNYASCSYMPVTQVSCRCKSKSSSSEGQAKGQRCPVCLTDRTWLPKFTACPKCGAKPTPAVAEPPAKPKEPTAEKILIEYLGKPPPTIDSYCADPCAKPQENEDTEDECRCYCKCKYNKVCAHCRIREMVADVYKAKKRLKQAKCIKPEPRTAEECCVLKKKSSESFRPFLEQVFSELRDLYDLKSARGEPIPETQKHTIVEPGPSTARVSHRRMTLGENRPRRSGRQSMIQKGHIPESRPMQFGHKHCLERGHSIPSRHGWNWLASTEARRYGWRPGCVTKRIKKLMNFFLEYTPKSKEVLEQQQKAKQAKQNERPILNVTKRNGEIFITLTAVNSAEVQMQPIEFRVVKSELAVALREIKRKLKDAGFRKCVCHQTLSLCTCRDEQEKAELSQALQAECPSRRMQSCVQEHLILTDTSDSEIEFDFDVTPPAGIKKCSRSYKPQLTTTTTQTNKADVKLAPTYPMPLDPYYRPYDCAVADRFINTAYGQPGEIIFEDGVFAYRQGGPHGLSAQAGGRPKSKLIWGEARGGPMRGGGRFLPQVFGGKSFPYAPKPKGKKSSKPIPVRMPQRFYKAAEEAKAKEAAAAEKAKAKKAPDMMKYMMAKGAISVPWNPNANAY